MPSCIAAASRPFRWPAPSTPSRSPSARCPGARYSLDELCRRFGVDTSARTKHGALLDAQLTAEIYLELIGGRQRGLMLAPAEIAASQAGDQVRAARQRPEKLAPLITAVEIELHAAFVARELGDKTLWKLDA